jgi:Pyridoxamine 5'-phosphate oxidase
VSASVPSSGKATAAGPAAGPTTERVWRELSKASFAVLGYVTPRGEPRSSGVVYGTAGRHVYVVSAPDSWKVRHIRDGDQVAVTVPVRRGGLLALIAPIPPATVSFRATAVVHPPGSLDLASVSKKLASLLPKQRSTGSVFELAPEGTFLTYGVGVSLRAMTDPAAALAHVPVS